MRYDGAMSRQAAELDGRWDLRKQAYQVALASHPHLLSGQRLELKAGSRASRGEVQCNTGSCGSVDFCVWEEARERRANLKTRVESHLRR
jgi:hypothetical protein